MRARRGNWYEIPVVWPCPSGWSAVLVSGYRTLGGADEVAGRARKPTLDRPGIAGHEVRQPEACEEEIRWPNSLK